jgi:hypothetical protein
MFFVLQTQNKEQDSNTHGRVRPAKCQKRSYCLLLTFYLFCAIILCYREKALTMLSTGKACPARNILRSNIGGRSTVGMLKI